MVDVLLLAGWAFEVAAGRREAAESATREALEGWVARGLGYRLDSDRRRLFDPVEVVNFLKWEGLTGADRFWADRFVTTGRALVEDLSTATAAPARFQMTLERTFDLRRFTEGARVRLRAPLPLPGSGVEDLQAEALPAASSQAQVSLRGDHMEVRCEVPPCRAVTIGVRFALTPPSRSAPVAPRNLASEERDLYLRAAEGLIQVTPAVEVLAASLAGDALTPQDAVAAFWAHLLDGLVCGAIRYSDLQGRRPVDWVLDHGWYDCQLGSALLVSLCRARGIPARLVGGHLLYRLAPTNHYWSEIWLEGLGWRSYDLLCWDLSEGGKDVIWRDRFAGEVDPRVVTQRLPLAFTGPMSVRFPTAWQMTQTAAGEGIDISYWDIEDRSLIFKDHVVANRLVEPPVSVAGC